MIPVDRPRGPDTPTLSAAVTTGLPSGAAPRRLVRRAWSLAVAGASASATALLCYRAAGWPGGAPALVAATLTALTWLATGLAVAVARPRLPFGWLLLGGGVCLAAGELLTGAGAWRAADGDAAAGAWLSWTGGWVFFPHLAANVLIYLLFPVGRLPSRRWRVWIPVTAVALLLLIVSQASTPTLLTDMKPVAAVANPVPHPAWAAGLLPAGVAAMNLAFVAGLAALLVRVVRPVGLTAQERVAVRWVLGFAVVNQAVGVLLVDPPGPWVFALAVPATACMTVSIALALVRHDLWGVRDVIGRALAYLCLSAAVVGVFAATLTVTAAAFGESARVLGVPVAALIVCLGLGTAQRRVHAAVDRLMYGRRHEPYAVLAELGAALETAGEPVDALARLTETTAQALRAPWVAIELDGRIVVEHGAATRAAPVRLPLRHHGSDLGELVVAHRAGEAGFSTADRQLLGVLARQAGAAAHAVALTAALRASRERVVAARETERRRLRRDLHDGIASALTAVGLTADVAADSIVDDPVRGAGLVRKARADIAAVLAEVRRVIDDLSPGVLADSGLAGALAELADRFDDHRVRVTTDLPGHRPHLPAALEVAAYRIAAEALQNAARHAAATRVHLELVLDQQALRLTVTDDGRGLPAHRRSGVGLVSMRERAEEVGGTLAVEPTTPHGTTVAAVLPVWNEEPNDLPQPAP